MPKSAQELIVYYYDKYYGNHHELLSPKNRFTLSEDSRAELASIFHTSDENEAFRILKDQLAYYNCSIPTLYKQYADLCEEGGISFMGYNIDKDFENCVDSFILVEIDKIKSKKKERYIKGV